MNVLKKVGKNSCWNLLGSESSHAVSIVRPEGVFEVYIYLSSYTCEEEIEVRNSLFNGAGDGAYYDFIDKHFIKFGGVEPDDPERHKMYLDNLVEVKRFIYEECVQGVRNDPSVLDSDTLEESIIVVPTVHDLYDPEEDREVQFHSFHTLDSSEEYYSEYAACVDNRSSEELLEIELDFNRVGRIYNSSISSVKGFLLDNEQCVEDNKSEWVGRIPFEYKFACVDEAFAPSRTE